MVAEQRAGDFDFLHGHWRVLHRKLATRLAGSNDWMEFDGTCTATSLLGGDGNVDDNVLNQPTGAYRALSLRTCDPRTREWVIWWLDSRFPPNWGSPVHGVFTDGVGAFYSDDMIEGRRMITRFLWTRADTDAPRWEQALSVDGGASWETNWTMQFLRAEP